MRKFLAVSVLHEGAEGNKGDEHAAHLQPDPYSSKGSLVTGPGDGPDFYMHLQPYKDGWIVSSRGVHRGFVKRFKRRANVGWDLQPLGRPSR